MAGLLIPFHTQTNADGAPVGGVLIAATSPQWPPWQETTNACGDCLALLAPGHYSADISAPGFAPTHREWDFATPPEAPVLIGLDRVGPFRPVPRLQARLPDWDASDVGGAVHTTPPPELVIPARYDVLFWRGDFNGIDLDATRWGGIPPYRQGANTTPPTMLMSPMLPLYPRRWQDAHLTEAAERNYSHMVFASSGWNFDTNGYHPSPQDVVDWARYIQSWGFFAVYWGPAILNDPYLQALVDAHAIDFHIAGEEVDTIPGMTAEQYDAILKNALHISGGGIPVGAHFTSNYPEGFPRDTYVTNWAQYNGQVHLCWQAHQDESAGTQAARLYYARQRVNLGLVGGNGQAAPDCRVIAFETEATNQLYYGNRVKPATLPGGGLMYSEAYGCLRSLELLFATRRQDQPGIRAVAGCGNGLRFHDGSWV